MNITVDYVTFVLQTRLRVLWAIKENFIRHVKRLTDYQFDMFKKC